MTIIRSLASWIAFAIAGAFLGPQWAALVALVAAAISLAVPLVQGGRPGEVVIEISSLVFFAAYTIFAFSRPGDDLHDWVSPASQFWLAVTVGITLLIHKPFTLALAKKEAPPESWEHPAFYAFNVRITLAWLISFALSGLILVVLILTGVTAAWITVVVIVLAICAPVVYTNRQVAAIEAELGGEGR